MPISLDPLVAELVERLDVCNREWFEERAGIVEFDTGETRLDAERLALLMLLRRNPAALTGVSVLEAEVEATTLWMLTTTPDRARKHLAELGCRKIRFADLTCVVRDQFEDIAFIAVS